MIGISFQNQTFTEQGTRATLHACLANKDQVSALLDRNIRDIRCSMRMNASLTETDWNIRDIRCSVRMNASFTETDRPIS